MYLVKMWFYLFLQEKYDIHSRDFYETEKCRTLTQILSQIGQNIHKKWIEISLALSK
jgi:hypothetical protein